MKAPAGKAPVPHTRTNWGWGFDAVQIFFGAAGGTRCGAPIGSCCSHLEERGWVKLQRSGRKLECIPQWESIFWGGYDPGREASYEGAVEGPTITCSIKLLGPAAPATSSTTGPTGAP